MRRLCTGVLIVLVMYSCSTLGKSENIIYEQKNEAAGYLKLADEFTSKGQYASALQYYNQALETNLIVDNQEGAIKARSSLGRVYLLIQNYEEAYKELQHAYEDAKFYGDNDLIALCLCNLGEYYYAKNNLEQALSVLQEAKSLLSKNNNRLLAVILHNTAVVYVKQARYDEAKPLLESASNINIKEKKWSEYAANCYTLGIIANKTNNNTIAEQWMQKALDGDKKAENSRGILLDLEALGKLAQKAGAYEKSFDFYRRAFYVALLLNDVGAAKRCITELIQLSEKLGRLDDVKRYTEMLSKLP